MNITAQVTRKAGLKPQTRHRHGGIGRRPASTTNQRIGEQLFVCRRVMRNGEHVVIGRMAHADHIEFVNLHDRLPIPCHCQWDPS